MSRAGTQSGGNPRVQEPKRGRHFVALLDVALACIVLGCVTLPGIAWRLPVLLGIAGDMVASVGMYWYCLALPPISVLGIARHRLAVTARTDDKGT
eukprot:8488211-Pyramimonas_sp.AAC.1